MKKLLISAIILQCLVSSCNFSSNQKGDDYSEQFQKFSINQQKAIDSIQFKAYNSFVKSVIDKSARPMDSILVNLTNQHSKNPSNILLYWKGYLLYYKSIYFLKVKDKPNSEKTILEGIDIFEDMKKKNVEDYAMLALLQSFSIQFTPGIKASFSSGKAKKYLKYAMETDPSNLRANFVYASHDYYTPAKYGGGKEVETYLLKAISLPDQKVRNSVLPSWGKEESYAMLVRFYIEKENWDSAKKYYQEGLKIFPDSYSINQYAPKLIGN